MTQLLVTLIVPPIVGLIAYIVVRRIWEREEDAPSASEAVGRSEPSMTDKSDETPAHEGAQVP